MNEIDELKDLGYSWTNLYDIIFKFEEQLAEYTGAPYAVTTDCCTHAMELCFRYLESIGEKPTDLISIPKHTYLSVPMMLKKINIPFNYYDNDWIGEYQFHGSPVWDSARLLAEQMYIGKDFQCLSFGVGKPLQLGRGGAILTSSKSAYEWLSRARSDGRDLKISPWKDDTYEFIGYHYNMTIEQAAKGIIMLDRYETNVDIFAGAKDIYPDCSTIKIG
tara:strand:- start:380 stop:1036 length:657 start_codon:yes stop_codon:yes gene_type:complete